MRFVFVLYFVKKYDCMGDSQIARIRDKKEDRNDYGHSNYLY